MLYWNQILTAILVNSKRKGRYTVELYQKMYAIACAGLSDALEALPETVETAQARMVLQRALDEAEELYLAQDDGE